MNDAERAEGARLLAAMTPPNWVVYPDNHSADGWPIFGPDGDGLVTCHGNCGMQATEDGGDERADAAGIAWLVNHAAELLRESAELAACRAERDRPREALGRLVRETWVLWAREQPDPHPGWLTPWETLDAGQREVDMRIGQAVADALLHPLWHDRPPDRDRLAATLAWYAATDDADRAADQGRRAREALRAAGRGDAIAAAEAAIRRERDAG